MVVCYQKKFVNLIIGWAALFPSEASCSDSERSQRFQGKAGRQENNVIRDNLPTRTSCGLVVIADLLF